MTITKQDLDNWIEREAEEILFPHVDKRPFRFGAQLLAPLLLQAIECLEKYKTSAFEIKGTVYKVGSKAEEVLTQIETAVKGGAK